MKKNKVVKYILMFSIILCVSLGGLYYATLAGMYKGAGKLLTISWVAQWKMNYPTQVTNNDCSKTWSPAVNGEVPYQLPMYPEVKAAYWMIPMSQDPEVFEHPVAYRVQGRFPFARYMSFHTYDATTGDYVAAIKDVEINADEGSVNPYNKSVDRANTNRNYTLWVVPEGASLPQINAAENILVIPQGVKFSPSVLRVYRADEDKGLAGGVSLPKVTVFDAQSGLAVNQCAPLRLVAPKSIEEGADTRRFDRRITINKNIHMYRSIGEGFYPNKHNAYLLTEFDRGLGEMAIVKWKSATTPKTKDGGGMFTHGEELRYWSFCLGGEYASNTSFCLVDDQARIDEEGFVTLVLGPDDDSLIKLAEEAGINYIPWGIHYRPLTILRNMEGERGFSKSAQHVPGLDASKPITEQAGDHFIGEYSPTGYYCSKDQFKQNFCDIENFAMPVLIDLQVSER